MLTINHISTSCTVNEPSPLQFGNGRTHFGGKQGVYSEVPSVSQYGPPARLILLIISASMH